MGVCRVRSHTGTFQGAGVELLPIDADRDQVEDGGGAANDVRSDVEIADHFRQTPHTPIYLKENNNIIFSSITIVFVF